jgi:hypothetical protein
VIRELMRASAPLTSVGVAMLALLAVTVAGLALDPRVIAGAPAWLKPAKFAASISIYTLTLAAIFTQLHAWVRTRRIVGWVTSVALIVEMIIIIGQVVRGTTSHFNVGTPLDAVLFSMMGIIIVLQTLTTVTVAVALWRTQLPDRALGWALRLGMTLTIVGAFSGGLMTRPTAAQLAAARGGTRMAMAGAHTVGAPDGGAGLPGTGWSVEHGDLRVAHFVGLHAVQVLPLIALALRRRLADRARVRVVTVAAVGHAALFALLLWQALRGQSLVAPDQLTAAALGAWAVFVAAALAAAVLFTAEVRRPVIAR